MKTLNDLEKSEFELLKKQYKYFEPFILYNEFKILVDTIGIDSIDTIIESELMDECYTEGVDRDLVIKYFLIAVYQILDSCGVKLIPSKTLT